MTLHVIALAVALLGTSALPACAQITASQFLQFYEQQETSSSFRRS